MDFFADHRLYKLLTDSYKEPVFSPTGDEEQPVLATLSAPIGAADTVIPCTFILVPPVSGLAWIEDELIYYETDSGVTAQLTNCIRNYDGKGSNSHASGIEITNTPDVENDVSRVARIYEDVLQDIYKKIKDFIHIKDIDQMPLHILPYESEELGWPLNVSKSEAWQRKWVKILVPMYKRKGTKRGIRDIVYFLTGFKGQVFNFFDASFMLDNVGTDQLFVNVAWQSEYNIATISRDAIGLVTVTTVEQSCGTIATHTGTQTEPFNISQLAANNKFKIRIDNNVGSWTEIEVTIPDNPVYTANQLATAIRNQVNIDGFLLDDDGSGKLKMEMAIVGDTRKFQIMAIADNCYTDVGLTVGTYVGTLGLVVKNRINVTREDDWTLDGDAEVYGIVSPYSFQYQTNTIGLPVSYGAGGKVTYIDPRPYITHVVKSGGEKDEIIRMLAFQRPASSRDYNIWTLFYDDFSLDLAGVATPFWTTIIGTALLNETDETLALSDLVKAIRVTEVSGDTLWKSYYVWADAKAPEGVIVGIIGKYQGQNDYYSVEMDITNQTVTLNKIVAGIKTALLTSPYVLQPDTLYRLALEIQLIYPYQREVLFHDNFVDGANWIIQEFPISFATGIMTITQDSVAQLNQTFSDVTLWEYTLTKIIAKTSANAILEIMFRMQANSQNECFVLYFDPPAKQIRLARRWIDSILGNQEALIATAAIPWLYQETWYHIWIEAWGSQIKVRIDGDEFINVIDATYLTGNLALKSLNLGFSKISERMEVIQLDDGIAAVYLIDDFTDYRSFAENQTYVGWNFWLVDPSYNPPATSLKYLAENNFLGEIIDQTFFTGKAGLLSEFGTSTFKQIEVIGLPKDETLIAYDQPIYP